MSTIHSSIARGQKTEFNVFVEVNWSQIWRRELPNTLSSDKSQSLTVSISPHSSDPRWVSGEHHHERNSGRWSRYWKWFGNCWWWITRTTHPYIYRYIRRWFLHGCITDITCIHAYPFTTPLEWPLMVGFFLWEKEKKEEKEEKGVLWGSEPLHSSIPRRTPKQEMWDGE